MSLRPLVTVPLGGCEKSRARSACNDSFSPCVVVSLPSRTASASRGSDDLLDVASWEVFGLQFQVLQVGVEVASHWRSCCRHRSRDAGQTFRRLWKFRSLAGLVRKGRSQRGHEQCIIPFMQTCWMLDRYSQFCQYSGFAPHAGRCGIAEKTGKHGKGQAALLPAMNAVNTCIHMICMSMYACNV